MHITLGFSTFDEGYLQRMLTDKFNDKIIHKLENHELTRIATMLGELSHLGDIYNELFEQPNHTLLLNSITIQSKDLAAFVIMDHTFTRGYFAKQAGRKATLDTTNCQGVPLALEGAKRLYNKSYMSWIPDTTDLAKLMRLDIFLPAHLSSYEFNPLGEVVSMDKFGLLRLYMGNTTFSSEIINQIREQVPTWLTTPSPKLIAFTKLDEEKYGKIYNNCDHKLRCLILQGWVWSKPCANDAMIRNLSDWDAPAIEMGEEANSKDNMLPPGLKALMGDEYIVKFKKDSKDIIEAKSNSIMIDIHAPNGMKSKIEDAVKKTDLDLLL